MDVESFRSYCLNKKGVTEEFPFDESTLVFKVMGKMFALVALERLPSQCNLKCDPDRALELREEYEGLIIPGYHMSKKHWNTLLLDSLPPNLIIELVDHSYDLVVSKLPKTIREQMQNMP
ncbi:MmcQ/YjbR family DNA-binding protein [Flagellimonas meridianipacifica]|uniref:Putative DNA-binding protein (MmcQ/YjbR family) n=1 Tax=Flagellimonas meridianipacifica TaxID=1080225 RepID=A0A2T0MIZ3_9FLAO|nr:MmcQ/YjbR family DNA-binding protein [Allomuricauda pacifica]PRX57560.1 putative DNA-binding protein (MmcQ/YjbR family) [Allomuricauda pacifica]